MKLIPLKKIRRIHFNEWEYSYGNQIILVSRTYPSSYRAFARPKINNGDAIFRAQAGDLNHFIREFRKHLERVQKQIQKQTP